MASSQEQYGNVANYNIIPKTRGDGQSSALETDDNGNLKINIAVSGLSLNQFDYVARAYDSNVTETWTFYRGGSGGTLVNTIVIVYTDSTLATILNVTKT
jgi:hypothetical protein